MGERPGARAGILVRGNNPVPHVQVGIAVQVAIQVAGEQPSGLGAAPEPQPRGDDDPTGALEGIDPTGTLKGTDPGQGVGQRCVGLRGALCVCVVYFFTE